MLNGIMPVSPTGTTGSLDRIKVIKKGKGQLIKDTEETQSIALNMHRTTVCAGLTQQTLMLKPLNLRTKIGWKDRAVKQIRVLQQI